MQTACACTCISGRIPYEYLPPRKEAGCPGTGKLRRFLSSVPCFCFHWSTKGLKYTFPLRLFVAKESTVLRPHWGLAPGLDSAVRGARKAMEVSSLSQRCFSATFVCG